MRLATARLYGQLFAAYELEEIISGESKKRRKKGKKAKKEKKTVEYILQDCVLKVSWIYLCYHPLYVSPPPANKKNGPNACMGFEGAMLLI